MTTPSTSDADLWAALSRAAALPPVHHALAAICAWVDEYVATSGAKCLLSGRCCRFDQYGHRLYVTALETASFLRQLAAVNPAALPTPGNSASHSGCPYQQDNRCSVHPIRPAGCRLFFCDQTTHHWQSRMYENLQCRLRRLHDDMHLPYRYLEWRAALASARLALGSGQAAAAAPADGE